MVEGGERRVHLPGRGGLTMMINIFELVIFMASYVFMLSCSNYLMYIGEHLELVLLDLVFICNLT